MKKYKLIKSTLATTLVLISLPLFSGCTKKVDCNIEGKHLHIYINEDNLLKKYINSEKEILNNFKRTDNFIPMTKKLEIIVENDLYRIEDNIDYLNNIINQNQNKRQAYVFGNVYGQYVGYGHGLNPISGKIEYFYGTHIGYHPGYEWQDISLDEHTEAEVRDITYEFKLYKINADGSLSFKLFKNLDDNKGEYKYFKENDLVNEIISKSYYLSNGKTK